METIQEYKDGDVYRSDVDISKDEWLGFLKDKAVSDNYKEAVACFYYLPDHKGSCVSAGKPFGKKPASLNASIWQFGRYVQNRLNRFELIGTDGKSTFWPVAMGQGKPLKGADDGSFEWQLRPELAEAVKDWLYWRMLETYKAHRREVDFNTEGAYEIYKWQLITATQGKKPIEIVQNHIKHPNNATQGGFCNLYDVVRDNNVLKYLVNNKLSQFETVLTQLVDESLSLTDRLAAFKTQMADLVSDTNYNSKANDERMAATILTCSNPQRYTIYKDGFYRKFCQYLGVATESVGKKYGHYLQLLEPLVHLIENDSELHEIIENSSIHGLLQSNLLLAQDVCWELFESFPKLLEIIKKETDTNYWLLSWNPENWEWKNYDDFCRKTKSGGTHIEPHTCHSTKPRIGDEVFLMKTGKKEPKGIIAHGTVVKESYTAPHYDSDKAEQGVTKAYIDASYDCILNYKTEPILDIKTLKDNLPKQDWSPQSSGIEIKENIEQLLKLWNETIGGTKMKNADKYVSLLKSNHNLILTGAPGTGKTYLAKQIAQAMGCTDNEIGFVQFHPSYDYTDFVEGLRPLDDGNGNVGFERKDGVFKEFCAKALENLTDSQKSLQTLQQETSVRDLIDDFVQDAIDSDLKLETQGTKNVFHIIENKAKHITIDIPKNEKTRVIALPKSDLITLLENKVDISGSKDIQLYFQRKYRTQQDSYTYVLYEKLKSLESKTKVETVSLIPKKNFVFIIDEINRGEINKIFGELFFSIDPGYRGEKGRVQTQYQNMVEDGDAFKKGFFVPENVYIIGTMNDIDRSVESMDFAFRRRFAFKEVTADDSKAMLDDFEWKDDAVKRMDSLNAAIEEIEGLSSAYHIGASYFLKLKNYNGDFGQLWDCHLKGLLFEYLRGTQSVDENMRKLEKAYNLNNTAADDSDTDN